MIIYIRVIEQDGHQNLFNLEKSRQTFINLALFFNPFENSNIMTKIKKPAIEGFLCPINYAFELIYHSRNFYAHLGI